MEEERWVTIENVYSKSGKYLDTIIKLNDTNRTSKKITMERC